MRSMKEIILQIKERVNASNRPLILFDDDPDGLAAFLLLYRITRSGKGMPIKGKPLDQEFVERVNAYQPDLVIILDKHQVADEFFQKIRAPCIWIDHHKPQRPPSKVMYLNPRRYDETHNIPTSGLCYLIAQQDEWIAATGIISDWELPSEELWNTLLLSNPHYLPKTINSPPEGLYTTPAGKMARIFSFLLKGKITQVMTALKIFSRINSPEELLEEQHAQARLVMKLYKQREQEYQNILEKIEVSEDPLIVYTYSQASTSYTTDLSNELLYKNPTKIIVIGRESNGSYKCSLRASNYRLDDILASILNHVQGEGGGHEHACGAVIPSEELHTFLELLRKTVSEAKSFK